MEMIMKVNVPLLKRLREKKSWSQEHLAEASGLGLRTIQRVEREGNASAETRLALAAALDVDVERLGSAEPAGTLGVEKKPSRLGPEAAKFLRHAFTYALVNAFLMWMDWRQNGRLTWSLYPLAGWGLGLLSHGLRVFLSAARE